jgi:hypothetical protein
MALIIGGRYDQPSLVEKSSLAGSRTRGTVSGTTRLAFGPNDVLFAPAGVEHRFEAFSDDLVVWVIFYGPEGGEA